MSFLSSLFPCFRDDPPPAPRPTISNPWMIGPTVNGVNYSAGMPPQPAAEGNGAFAFDIPQTAPGVHGMTRQYTGVVGPGGEYAAGSLSPGSGSITMSFTVATAADILEVDAPDGKPLPGCVRLFLQRAGDDWGGPNSGKSSYRFYSSPCALVGGGTLATALSPELWTNVDGQQDADGFSACLANLATVGVGFGGRFAMHGVIATGPARFTLLEYTVSP